MIKLFERAIRKIGSFRITKTKNKKTGLTKTKTSRIRNYKPKSTVPRRKRK